jgi:hypothetical protein
MRQQDNNRSPGGVFRDRAIGPQSGIVLGARGQGEMDGKLRQPGGPYGGLQVQANVVRRWRWSPAGELLSAPVRCKREQWYLARGYLADGVVEGSPAVLLKFLHEGEAVSQRWVALRAVAQARRGEALLGWVQAPEDATYLQVCLPETPGATRFDRLLLHPVAECDPKCHPLANVPRWSSCRPVFPIERIVLPASLEVLAERLTGLAVELVGAPRSLGKLAARAIGAACVIDGQWVRELGLELADLERVAAGSWLIVDLETLAMLVDRAASARSRTGSAGLAHAKTVTYNAEHEIMAARVAYADVPTRGFALEDVIPYATLAGETVFRTRVLRASMGWKRYAAETGFATLLASETPWEEKCGDVLSAARAIDHGELIVTDLPWLVAGQHGRLLAPRLAEHLLRMHLGGPIADSMQYWNRWDDCRAMVRDVADMPRWYPPLRAVRWASEQRGLARLGITLPAAGAPAYGRHLMVCTGRIDRGARHDGVPPEPMVIFMKWLAREVRERTRWATRYLADTVVTWQFDTADGLEYALHYDSAAGVATGLPLSTLLLRADGGRAEHQAVRPTDPVLPVWMLPADAGIFGDDSLRYQADLTGRLRRWIEQARR